MYSPGGGEWTQPPPAHRITDVWRLERLTREVQSAYDALAKQGEINVEKITVSRASGLAVIEYTSTLPPDWTREALKGKMTHDTGHPED